MADGKLSIDISYMFGDKTTIQTKGEVWFREGATQLDKKEVPREKRKESQWNPPPHSPNTCPAQE